MKLRIAKDEGRIKNCACLLKPIFISTHVYLIRKKLRFALSIIAVVFLFSCAPHQKPALIQQQQPSPVPQGPTTDEVFENLSQKEENSLKLWNEDKKDEAKRTFEDVLAIYFASPDNIQNDERIQSNINGFLDHIVDLEMNSNRIPDEEEEGTEEETPIDKILQMTTFISPEEIKEGLEKVKKEIEEGTMDIPIPLNDSVLLYIKYFTGPGREWLTRALDRAAPYIHMMKEKFKENGLPQDLAYQSLIESAFNPYARSRAGAVGPWQFMPGTAKKYSLTVNRWLDERRDPVHSTKAAVLYLKDLYALFGDIHLAMAAYNAGEGSITRRLSRCRKGDFWQLRSSRCLPRETSEYVPAILAVTLIAKNLKDYGFELNGNTPIIFDTVNVPGATSIAAAAEAAEVEVQDILDLNPELRRLITPPVADNYELRLPSGSGERFTKNFSSLTDTRKLNLITHTIKPGDTIKSIAKRYGISANVLTEANNISRYAPIEEGKTLVIPLPAHPSDIALLDEPSRPSRKSRGVIRTYRVHRGDTISSIAIRYGCSTEEVKRINNLASSTIFKGQVLKIPGKAVKMAMRSSHKKTRKKGHYHTVRKGDTLYNISRRYGVKIESLCSKNGISQNSTLTPGKRLSLP